MYKWNCSEGGARIEVKSTRPVGFEADLDISIDGNAANVQGETLDDGTVVFELSATQVHALRTNNTAFLGLTTVHTRLPGAPTNEWGYCYRVVQGGQVIAAEFIDDGGEEMTVGDEGVLFSAFNEFPPTPAFTQETILIK